MTVNDAFPLGPIVLPNPVAPITEPEPGLERQVLAHTPAIMLVRHSMRKGWRGAAHHHPHEQLVYIISGALEIEVAGVIQLRTLCQRVIGAHAHD